MILTNVFTLHLFIVIACLMFYILDINGRKRYSTPKADRFTVYISLIPGLNIILMLFIIYDYLIHKDD